LHGVISATGSKKMYSMRRRFNTNS